jgi:hypothetical protein
MIRTSGVVPPNRSVETVPKGVRGYAAPVPLSPPLTSDVKAHVAPSVRSITAVLALTCHSPTAFAADEDALFGVVSIVALGAGVCGGIFAGLFQASRLLGLGATLTATFAICLGLVLLEDGASTQAASIASLVFHVLTTGVLHASVPFIPLHFAMTAFMRRLQRKRDA